MKKILLRVIKIIVLIILVVSLPYFLSPIYDFPKPKPFSGNKLYNPYQNLTHNWLKANFHTHSKAWRGLTNGATTPEYTIYKYDSLGYNVISISNYNTINTTFDTSRFYIPIYEHGVNIPKIHQLVLGAKKVDFFDYPFWQLTSHKQYLINRLKKDAKMIVIAHPKLQSAYTSSDMQCLTNYELVEAMSGHAHSEKLWDAALSAGHSIWGTSNDDCHDAKHIGNTGVRYNLINVPENSDSTTILTALKQGKFYASKGWVGRNIIHLKKLVNQGDTISIELKRKVDSVLFIGQNGEIKQVNRGIKKAAYIFNKEDTYIRVVCWKERFRIYFNPIIRYDDTLPYLKQPMAKINLFKTWSYRLVLFLIYIAGIKWIFFGRKVPKNNSE